MEVAEELFAKHGFSGTSVREIAKGSGVNVAMISYYFESKEKLLEAIFHAKGDYLQNRVENLVNNKNLTNWQKLDMIIDEYVQKFSTNRLLHRIILREHGLNNCGHVRQFINERKYKHFKTMTAFIKKGQKEGDFNPDIDMLMLYTLLPGVTKHMLFNEDFLKYALKKDRGKEISYEDLQDQTKNFLKKIFRLILEKK